MPSNSVSYNHLKEKWVGRHRSLQTKLWEKHKDVLRWASDNLPIKQLVATSLGGLLLLSQPSLPLFQKPPVLLAQVAKQTTGLDKNARLMLDLAGNIPSEVRPLDTNEEENVSRVLSQDFGFSVVPELEGKRLNRSYGVIGYEQHLVLYPGGTIYSHFENEKDSQLFGHANMAPGLGAWGYFAKSKDALTQEDILREKYYIAVQTFLAPGFNEHVAEYRDFFKFRKMLVINPENGKAIVAVIGDAGPSPWTGKHLGGSPEVMSYLNRFDGSQKGAVLYMFVDDQENKVPLGPIEIQ